MGPFHADSPENIQGDVIAKDGVGTTDRIESSLSGLTFAMLSEGSQTEDISTCVTPMLRCINKVPLIKEQQRKLLSVSGKSAPHTGTYTQLA